MHCDDLFRFVLLIFFDKLDIDIDNVNLPSSCKVKSQVSFFNLLN